MLPQEFAIQRSPYVLKPDLKSAAPRTVIHLPTFKRNECVLANAPFPWPAHRVYLSYFEVEILHQGPETCFAVGLCAAAPPGDRLPGWDKNTIAYHSDDGGLFSGSGAQAKKLGPAFGVGDVVGCGRAVDGTIIFTLNGVLLQPTEKKFKGVLYPAVGGSDGGTWSPNFGTRWFRFPTGQLFEILNGGGRRFGEGGVSLLPPPSSPSQENERTPIGNFFKSDYAAFVLSFFTDEDLKNLELSCSQAYRLVTSPRNNFVWEAVTRQRWIHIPAGARVGNWRKFHHQRALILRQPEYKGSAAIENCGAGLLLGQIDAKTRDLPEGFRWELRCPVAGSLLDRTGDITVDFCRVCKENVYVVNSEAELAARVSQGQCVSFDPDKLKSRVKIVVRDPARAPKRGKIAVRRE